MSSTTIEFSKDERKALIQRIQSYFQDELDQDIGQFQAGFLLDFFADDIGPYFYNQALLDAQAAVELRLESVNEDIDGLMKTSSSAR